MIVNNNNLESPKELMKSKINIHVLDEIKILISLYCKNIELCMDYSNPSSFSFDENEAKALCALSNTYLNSIINLSDTWEVNRIQEIMSFIDKAKYFDIYFEKLINAPNESNFSFLEQVYDGLIVHANEI
ncbi:hypothetical protein [Vagococcus fluvialis]|uniref:hypothetical protein n=1 Tax=Vagococcus fluvialis TaxID=2738 RepID=UPI002FDB4DCB